MKGVVRVEIRGKSLAYMTHMLYKNKIHFRVVKRSKNMLTVDISDSHYNRLKKVKTSYEIKVSKYFGVKYFLYYLKDNAMLATSILFGVALVIFLSNLMFRLDVISTDTTLRDEIKNHLITGDLKYLHLIPTRKGLSEVKDNLMEEFEDRIEWLEITRVGTRITVDIEQRKLNPIAQNTGPGNIVASRSAVIRKIVATRGDIVKEVNQYVKKGEVIVSGIISHNEEEKRRVAANAKVYGEIWDIVRVEIPGIMVDRRVTDEISITYNFNLANFSFNLSGDSFRHQETEKEYLVRHSLLPIGLSRNTNRKVVERIFTPEEALEFGLQKSREKIEARLDDDEHIISSKQLKRRRKNSKIEIEVFYKIHGRIDRFVKIPKQAPKQSTNTQR